MSRARRLFFALLLTITSCKSAEQNQNTMEFLERGNFRGHLVVTTGGKIGGGMKTEFYGGTVDSAISAEGEADFSRPPGSSFTAAPWPTTQPYSPSRPTPEATSAKAAASRPG